MNEQEIQEKISELKKLPEKIKIEEQNILGLNNKINSLNNKKNWLEIKTYAEISKEVDDDGKLIHTNETKRKAAVEKRLRNNPDYEAIVEEEIEKQNLLGEAKIQAEYLKRVYSVAKAEIALITAIKGEKQ